MEAALRQRIRQARSDLRLQTHPWVPPIVLPYDSQHGICPHCHTEFEPRKQGRHIYCTEKCRKQASLKRCGRRRSKA